jgi:hypothetical protein
MQRGGGGGKDLISHEQHQQYSIVITSGTARQFVSKLRAEVETLVLAANETVYGSETVAPG